jgi:hypothetical protein
MIDAIGASKNATDLLGDVSAKKINRSNSDEDKHDRKAHHKDGFRFEMIQFGDFHLLPVRVKRKL